MLFHAQNTRFCLAIPESTPRAIIFTFEAFFVIKVERIFQTQFTLNYFSLKICSAFYLFILQTMLIWTSWYSTNYSFLTTVQLIGYVTCFRVNYVKFIITDGVIYHISLNLGRFSRALKRSPTSSVVCDAGQASVSNYFALTKFIHHSLFGVLQQATYLYIPWHTWCLLAKAMPYDNRGIG